MSDNLLVLGIVAIVALALSTVSIVALVFGYAPRFIIRATSLLFEAMKTKEKPPPAEPNPQD
jgi:hypothetical protein